MFLLLRIARAALVPVGDGAGDEAAQRRQNGSFYAARQLLPKRAIPGADFKKSVTFEIGLWVYLRRRIAMIKRIRSEVPEMDKAAKEYAKLVANAKVMAAELQRDKMVARRIEQPGCRPRRRAG